MKKFLTARLLLLILPLCLLASFRVCAAEQRQVVQLADLPAVVKVSIEKLSTGGKLGDIERVTDADGTYYDVDFHKDNVDRSFSVSANGKLLAVLVEMKELPEPVQKTIRENLGRGRLGEIDKNFDDDGVSYDVEIHKAGGGTRTVTVGADGKLLAQEITMNQAPEAVQKTIRAQVGAGTVSKIEKNFEDDELSYEVEAVKDGKDISLSIAPDGQLNKDG